MRDLFWKGLAPQLLVEFARDTPYLVDQFHHMYGYMDDARMLGYRAADGLANPPGGISAKAEAASRVELLSGPNQAQIAFLNKIEQRDPLIIVAFRDAYHEAKVGLD